jgi:hypothetical protein
MFLCFYKYGTLALTSEEGQFIVQLALQTWTCKNVICLREKFNIFTDGLKETNQYIY